MTQTGIPQAGAGSAAPDLAGGRPGVEHPPARFTNVVRSEWTKVWTVRSTYFALGATVLLVVGLGALIALGVGSHYHNNPGGDNGYDPVQITFVSLIFGQLALAVLAILTITSEYASGMIRVTLQAMPRRGWVLAAKAIVFAVVAFVVGEIISFVDFVLAQAVLKGAGAPSISLGAHDVLRAVIGAGLYLTAGGLLALAIGAIIRHTAGSITTVVALFFVIPGVSNALPASWEHPIQEYLPTDAGARVFSTRPEQFMLSSWVGFAVLCGYVVVLLAVAYWLLQRRDA